jgi:hypothetical protein
MCPKNGAVGEARGDDDEEEKAAPVLPEDIGTRAAMQLLEEIKVVWCGGLDASEFAVHSLCFVP